MNSLITRTSDARQDFKRARFDESALLGTFSQDIARQAVTLGTRDANANLSAGDYYGTLNSFNTRREGAAEQGIRGLADVRFEQGPIADHAGASEEFMSLSLRVASDNMDVTSQMQRMNVLIVPRQLTSKSQTNRNWTPAVQAQMLKKLNDMMTNGNMFSPDAGRHMELHRGEIYNAVPIQLFNYLLSVTGEKTAAEIARNVGLVVPVISEDGKVSRPSRPSQLPIERLFAVGVGGTCLVANLWGAVSPGDRLYFVLRRMADDKQMKRYGFNQNRQYILNSKNSIGHVKNPAGDIKERYQLVPVSSDSSGFIEKEHYVENGERYPVFDFGTVVEKASVPSLPSNEFSKGVFSMDTWASLCCASPLRVSVHLGCTDLQAILPAPDAELTPENQSPIATTPSPKQIFSGNAAIIYKLSNDLERKDMEKVFDNLNTIQGQEILKNYIRFEDSALPRDKKPVYKNVVYLYNAYQGGVIKDVPASGDKTKRIVIGLVEKDRDEYQGDMIRNDEGTLEVLLPYNKEQMEASLATISFDITEEIRKRLQEIEENTVKANVSIGLQSNVEGDFTAELAQALGIEFKEPGKNQDRKTIYIYLYKDGVITTQRNRRIPVGSKDNIYVALKTEDDENPPGESQSIDPTVEFITLRVDQNQKLVMNKETLIGLSELFKKLTTA